MIAKVAIFLTALAAVHANAILYGHAALVNTGVSARSQVQGGHGQFAFGYDIKDGKGATNSRSEVGDGHGNVKGAYTLADIDGRARKVEYVADGHGFRAVVKTNEPGTAASAPAAALIASPYAGPSDKIINHVAPAATIGHVGIASPMIAAPVAYGGVIGNGVGLSHGLGGIGLLNGGLGHGSRSPVNGGIGLGGLGLVNGGIGLGHGVGMSNGLLH